MAMAAASLGGFLFSAAVLGERQRPSPSRLSAGKCFAFETAKRRESPWCAAGASSFSIASSQSRGLQLERFRFAAASSSVEDEFAAGPEGSSAVSSDEFRGGVEDSAAEINSGSDEDEKVVKFDLQLPRRRLQVEFTCNVCQTRSKRLINPEAYKRGTVYVQCAGCEAYHQLVDNLNLVVEYDFREENASNSS